MLAEINSRINTANNGTYAGFEATWAMVVTWEDIPEVTSTQNTDNVSILILKGTSVFSLDCSGLPRLLQL